MSLSFKIRLKFGRHTMKKAVMIVASVALENSSQLKKPKCLFKVRGVVDRS